jgi:hypothetical protein
VPRLAGRDIPNNDLGVLIAGGVLLIVSLFHWFSFGRYAENAWGAGFFAYGGVEFGLLATALVAVRVFTRVQLPAVGADWVLIIAGVAGAGTFLILLKLALGIGGFDRAIGLWFGFIASGTVTAFAVLSVLASGYTLPARGPRRDQRPFPPPPPPGTPYDAYGRPRPGGYGGDPGAYGHGGQGESYGGYGQQPPGGYGQPPHSGYGEPPHGQRDQ